MKKLEIIIKPEKLEDLKSVLDTEEVNGLNIVNSMGYGNQKGIIKNYRGAEYAVNLLPKIKVETVVADDVAPGLIDKIVDEINTGHFGDGKIFRVRCTGCNQDSYRRAWNRRTVGTTEKSRVRGNEEPSDRGMRNTYYEKTESCKKRLSMGIIEGVVCIRAAVILFFVGGKDYGYECMVPDGSSVSLFYAMWIRDGRGGLHQSEERR